MPGKLYLVATPIGNLQDISFRAVEILRAVDIIACEDTRHSRKLLNAFEISNKLVSYHEHNEIERTEELIKELISGKSIALISDAGTPGINDPGFRLVNAAIEAEIDVISIPGAVAFVNAVIVSGLATDSVFFGGFLPPKKSARRKRLEDVRSIQATLVFYESPHRLLASLIDCFEILGERRAAVSRELTKLHEETIRGTISEIRAHFQLHSAKGEFVISIERGGSENSVVESKITLAERVAELEAESGDRRTALKQAAKEFGMSKSEAYRAMQT